jgi:peptide-methionine (S)-S-oxide reductase
MRTQKALFAAGCFWGVQYYFDQIPGVVTTTVGYTGGTTKSPTYDEVCSHTTGHAEALLIEFNPQKVTYITLLKHLFRMHNPTQLNRQGPDVGDQYRSAVFFFDEAQEASAKAIRQEAQSSYDKPVVTEITKAGPFYKAEAYHQKFTQRTGIGMCHIPYKPL